ncbi:MAG TPA: hypothetical protein VFP98_10785 [Candidatus Polarisedimenticolia bacterium]|nr:hypothetical protein [Candidatus Polarisedimenticolia bacterium]
MPRFLRGGLRLLAVVGLVAALHPLPSYTATAGRNFSRCIQACNDIRRACDDRCATDCRDLFPNSKPERDACIAACKAICLTESDDCKLVCQSIKDGHPEEP